MSKTVAKQRAPFADEKPDASQNLSEDIEAGVEREPHDRVRCVRVFGDFYRCNWWAPMAASSPAEQGQANGTTTTHRVRKSGFFHAEVIDGGIVITEQKRPPS